MSVRFCPLCPPCPTVRLRLSAARWRCDKWSPGRSPLRIRPQKHGLYNGHFLATFPADFFMISFLLFCGSCCSQFFFCFFVFLLALLTNHSMRVCVCACVCGGGTDKEGRGQNPLSKATGISFIQRGCQDTPMSGHVIWHLEMHLSSPHSTFSLLLSPLAPRPAPHPRPPPLRPLCTAKKGQATNPNHLINQSMCVLRNDS